MTAIATEYLAGRQTLRDSERRLRHRIFAPLPRLSVSEWADTRRRLSSEAAAVPGRWTSFPYQREIMDVCHSGVYRRVVAMLPSQTGKTEVLLNLVGYHMDLEPCPMLLVEPNLDMARTLGRDRIDPMLRDTPALQGHVAVSARRDSNNTMLFKAGAGWRLTLVGAGSPSGLSMRPVRLCLFDEVDRYSSSAGGEGDPVSLGEKRSATFPNRLTLLISSPGIKGESRMEREYEESDQRKWLVPCPHCEHRQSLEWGGPEEPFGLKWEDGKPDTAQYLCASCGALIGEEHKGWMNERGAWVAAHPERMTAGFQLTALASPVMRWADLVRDFLKANAAMKAGDPEPMKAFVTTSLARPWEEPGEKFDAGSLFARREKYAAEVPAGVGLLLAATDVQKDRIETTVWGFGAGEESWIIAHHRFYGDPEQPSDPCWQDLERLRVKAFAHESGAVIRIRAMALDFGFASAAVADYARKKRWVLVVKGDGHTGRQPISPPGKSKKHRVRLWALAPDYFKARLFNRLVRVTVPGPGYVHVPTAERADDAYLAQFGNERPRSIRRLGRLVRTYLPVNEHAAVEAIDCAYMALAALHILGESVRNGLESMAKRLQESGTPPESVASVPEPPASLPKRFPVKRRGWMRSW